jgi:hypothetical protein
MRQPWGCTNYYGEKLLISVKLILIKFMWISMNKNLFTFIKKVDDLLKSRFIFISPVIHHHGLLAH